MSKHTNMQRDVLVLNLEEQLEGIAQDKFDKTLKECTDRETYYVLLDMTTRLMDVAEVYNGEKKVYYISMEFLIGKLLSNNLINLRVYDRVKAILEKNGKNLAAIEECEPEPSLGNGGLGRLAACFLDSIATLGMAGEGIGVFLIVMMSLFIVTLYYATYRSYKEEEKFSYELSKIWIPVAYVAIGVALGIVAGYLVVTNAFKDDPEVVIDTALVLSIMSPATSLVCLLSIVSPIPLNLIFSKLRKK